MISASPMIPGLWGGDILVWVACGLAALLLVPWILGPILVRLVHWQSSEPEIVPRDPLLASNPADDFFAGICPPLADAGFKEAQRFSFRSFVPNVVAEMCTMVDRDSRIVAVVHVAAMTSGPVRARTLEFVSAFTDESMIDTTNSEVPLHFREIGKKRLYEVPMVQDPLRLLAVHRAIVRADGAGRAPKDPPPAAEIPTKLRESIGRDIETQAGWGYLKRIPGTPRYRVTAKGAVLFTWAQCWPLKSILRARRLRRAEALLRRLGLPGT